MKKATKLLLSKLTARRSLLRHALFASVLALLTCYDIACLVGQCYIMRGGNEIKPIDCACNCNEKKRDSRNRCLRCKHYIKEITNYLPQEIQNS